MALLGFVRRLRLRGTYRCLQQRSDSIPSLELSAPSLSLAAISSSTQEALSRPHGAPLLLRFASFDAVDGCYGFRRWVSRWWELVGGGRLRLGRARLKLCLETCSGCSDVDLFDFGRDLFGWI